jgi:glycerol-3-phosphate acyltransferase PlsY
MLLQLPREVLLVQTQVVLAITVGVLLMLELTVAVAAVVAFWVLPFIRFFALASGDDHRTTSIVIVVVLLQGHNHQYYQHLSKLPLLAFPIIIATTTNPFFHHDEH